MKRILFLCIVGGVYIGPILRSACYAQEKQLTVVVTAQASTMLSPETIQAQKELELTALKHLSTADRTDYYETLPNRSLKNVQSRSMTYEIQKACRGVERDYTVDIRFVSKEVAIAYWNFGDGKPSQYMAVSSWQGSLTTSYTYEVPGVYTIVVEFFDSSYRPTKDPNKEIEVLVEACLPPMTPELPVNPNIHKVTVQ